METLFSAARDEILPNHLCQAGVHIHFVQSPARLQATRLFRNPSFRLLGVHKHRHRLA